MNVDERREKEKKGREKGKRKEEKRLKRREERRPFVLPVKFSIILVIKDTQLASP